MSNVEVRTLHLRVADRAQVPPAVRLLEDALRVASWPWIPPGAVVLIEHLDLGALDLTRPSQALAARLTRVLRERMPRRVHGASPRAAAAPVVWFASPAEARVALIVALLRDAPRGWFWRHAVPTWAPGMALPAALEAAFFLPPTIDATEPPTLVQAAELVARLVDADVWLPVSHRVPVPTLVGRLWSAAVAVPAVGGDPPAPKREVAEAVDTVSLPERREAAIREAVRQFGRSDARVRWLIAALAVATRPALAAPGRLPEVVEGVLRRVAGRGLVGFSEEGWRREAGSPEGGRDRAPGPMEAGAPGAAPTGVGSVPETIAGAAEPGESSRDEQLRPPILLPRTTPSRPPWWLEGRADPGPSPANAAVPDLPLRGATRFGGLLFTVPLLHRLGFRGDPDDDGLGWRILAAFLARLSPAEDDVWLDVIAAAGPFPPIGEAGWESRDQWIARVDEALPSGGADDGLDLRALAERPGLVAATATHVDVVLPLAAVDLRVRRRALDADPGWVAWLGRVVTFHYVEGEDFAGLRAGIGDPVTSRG